MLVLSRKQGDRVRIADNIEITVLEIRGGRVRIGFHAPDEISIHREEVWRRSRQENHQPLLLHDASPATPPATLVD